MPHAPDAPDVVLPCRAGDNRELRFALRSIEKNFTYRHIWIVGAWPEWLREDHEHLSVVKRPAYASKYRTTRAHYLWACQRAAVSDPWVLWNDDFFCLTPTSELPTLHRGRCSEVAPLYRTWTSKWAVGMRETEALMKRIMPGRTLYNYDIHVPLLVHKAAMLHALSLAEAMKTGAPHVRTLYGNLQRLGGRQISDPKTYTKRTETYTGTWLSSQEDTFRTAVEPHLNAAGLHTASPFEIPGVPDKARPAPPGMRDPRSYSKRRMRYRVLNTGQGNRVVRDPEPATNHQRRRAVLEASVKESRRGKVGCLSCGQR